MGSEETLLYPYLITFIVAVLVAQLITVVLHGYLKLPTAPRSWLELKARPDALLTVVSSLLVATIIVEKTTSFYTVASLVLLWLALESRLYSGYFTLKRQSLLRTLLPTLFVGFLVGLTTTAHEWYESIDLLTSSSTMAQQNIVLAWSAALLVVSELTIFSIRRSKLRILPTSRKLIRAFRLSYTLIAIAGIGLVTAQIQFDIAVINSRFWYFLSIVWVLLATIISYKTVYAKAKDHLSEEAQHFKKQKKIERKKSKRVRKRKK